VEYSVSPLQPPYPIPTFHLSYTNADQTAIQMVLEEGTTLAPLQEFNGPPLIIPGDLIFETYGSDSPHGSFGSLFVPFLIDRCRLLSIHTEIRSLNVSLTEYFDMVATTIEVVNETVFDFLLSARYDSFELPVVLADANCSYTNAISSAGKNNFYVFI
jgi:hypothetical protein